MKTKRRKVLKDAGFNEDELLYIENMAKLGLTLKQCGAIMGVTKSAVMTWKKKSKDFKEAWERGRAQGAFLVGKVALEMALSGKHPDMTKFYLRSIAGWSDNVTPDEKDEADKLIVYATRIGDDGILKLQTTGDKESDKDVIDLDALDAEDANESESSSE